MPFLLNRSLSLPWRTSRRRSSPRAGSQLLGRPWTCLRNYGSSRGRAEIYRRYRGYPAAVTFALSTRCARLGLGEKDEAYRDLERGLKSERPCWWAPVPANQSSDSFAANPCLDELLARICRAVKLPEGASQRSGSPVSHRDDAAIVARILGQARARSELPKYVETPHDDLHKLLNEKSAKG